jgi:NAD(P)-dependent dehydrogenase (short-subunit alcohol dehydrogenase family)
VAIITGGGRGIGRAIALELARCGAELVLASRTEEELTGVVNNIEAASGKAVAQVTDLMSSDQIDALVNSAMNTYGRIDIVINNAARSFMLTKTAFSQPLWENPEVEQMVAAKIPKRRLGEPEDIVGALLFLCSEDSRYITGQTLYVDGGTLANY